MSGAASVSWPAIPAGARNLGRQAWRPQMIIRSGLLLALAKLLDSEPTVHSAGPV
jgi:hypothetical protein